MEEEDTFYFHLFQNKKVSKNELLDKIDEFIDFLKILFNDLYIYIIDRICEYLQVKLNIKVYGEEDLKKLKEKI